MHIEKYQACAQGRMLGHYERVFEVEYGFRRENIDPERTALNYNLGPERVGVSQSAFVKARIESLNLPRKPRKDAVRFCDAVLTLPVTFPEGRAREFFEESYAFLAERFGADNVVSAFVHMDEARPHMHFCWVPVTEDGRLSAKDVLCRSQLKTLHGDLKAWLEPRLGVPCDVLLDESQKAKKELSRLPQEDYKAARAEVAETEKRLEGVRRAEAAAKAAGRGALGTVGQLATVGVGQARVRRAEDEEEGLRAQVEELERAVRDAERRAEEETRELRELGERAERAAEEARRVDAGLRGLGERWRKARERNRVLEGELTPFSEAVYRVEQVASAALYQIKRLLGAFGNRYPKDLPLTEYMRESLEEEGAVEYQGDFSKLPRPSWIRPFSDDLQEPPEPSRYYDGPSLGGGSRGRHR